MNKQLRRAKFSDVLAQVGAVLLPLLFAGPAPGSLLLVSYILGGWQVLSYIVHLSAGTGSWAEPLRRTYGISLLVLLCCGIGSLILPGVIILFFLILPVAGVILGLMYFLISLTEWSNTLDLEPDCRRK